MEPISFSDNADTTFLQLSIVSNIVLSQTKCVNIRPVMETIVALVEVLKLSIGPFNLYPNAIIVRHLQTGQTSFAIIRERAFIVSVNCFS